MYFLGWMYYDGRAAPSDNDKAVKWFRRAAEAGDSDGMYWLGWMYEAGRGVNQDERESLSWYEKASKLGNENAKSALKRLKAKSEAATE